jgi:hypothetical protein
MTEKTGAWQHTSPTTCTVAQLEIACLTHSVIVMTVESSVWHGHVCSTRLHKTQLFCKSIGEYSFRLFSIGVQQTVLLLYQSGLVCSWSILCYRLVLIRMQQNFVLCYSTDSSWLLCSRLVCFKINWFSQLKAVLKCKLLQRVLGYLLQICADLVVFYVYFTNTFVNFCSY